MRFALDLASLSSAAPRVILRGGSPVGFRYKTRVYNLRRVALGIGSDSPQRGTSEDYSRKPDPQGNAKIKKIRSFRLGFNALNKLSL